MHSGYWQATANSYLTETQRQRPEPPIKQVAALPYATDRDGVTRVLLITSRRTRRWVVPKGNPIRGLASHEAAAQEAWEEAGLTGVPSPSSLGHFRYQKRRGFGLVEATVELFPFAVTDQAKDWPERKQREVKWFGIDEAAQVVADRELADLIAGFMPPTDAAPVDDAVSPFRAVVGKRFGLMDWLRSLMRR